MSASPPMLAGFVGPQSTSYAQSGWASSKEAAPCRGVHSPVTNGYAFALELSLSPPILPLFRYGGVCHGESAPPEFHVQLLDATLVGEREGLRRVFSQESRSFAPSRR